MPLLLSEQAPSRRRRDPVIPIALRRGMPLPICRPDRGKGASHWPGRPKSATRHPPVWSSRLHADDAAHTQGGRMRVRRSILVPILATTTAMVGTAAMAHHPDEEDQYSSVDSTQSTELESVIAGVPCVDGMAGEFPCDGIDLMSFIP